MSYKEGGKSKREFDYVPFIIPGMLMLALAYVLIKAQIGGHDQSNANNTDDFDPGLMGATPTETSPVINSDHNFTPADAPDWALTKTVHNNLNYLCMQINDGSEYPEYYNPNLPFAPNAIAIISMLGDRVIPKPPFLIKQGSEVTEKHSLSDYPPPPPGEVRFDGLANVSWICAGDNPAKEP